MNNHSLSKSIDVAIVGGGPAGLAAAMYLGRALRSVTLFDAGDARARLIPSTHNCPGFPEGIAGDALLHRLRVQAGTFGADIVEGRVEEIARDGDLFVLATTSGTVTASRVVLATGIVDLAPNINGLWEAIIGGAIRLCPVCDAYEAQGKMIGVAGPERHALGEALYLRDFSPHVALLFSSPDEVSDQGRRQARAAGIDIWDSVEDLVRRESGFDILMAGAPPHHVDLVYPAMGCNVRSELASMLDARCDEEGYIVVGPHLETSVPGLYAIGDVAKALNQIAVGFGHAALASAHIHNGLRRRMAKPTGEGAR